MKFLSSQLSFYEDGDKKERYKINLFAILKSCLYLILIDHFLISVDVYCAESSDFFVIEKESIGLAFKDQIEMLNGVTDKLKLNSQTRKNPKNTNDESQSKLNDKKEPSTTETDKSSSNTTLLEFKMLRLQCNLNSMYEYTIPDLIKDSNEDKDFQNKVFNLIEEIKSKVKSYDENLIEKIENKMKEKQNRNSKFDEIIETITEESKKLLLDFEMSKKIFYKAKTSQYFTLLTNFDDYIGFNLSKVDCKHEQLFKALVMIKLSFFKEKRLADSILMILTKVLELTPEEFKRDEEVSKAILSLN